MKNSLLKKGVAAAALLLSFNNAWAQDPCSGDGPGCQDGGGDFLMTSEFDSFEPGKAEGFFVAVGSKSTMKIDTAYSGSFSITKLSGPGEISGTPLSGPFAKWAFIPDFTFSAAGMYEIIVEVPGIGKDTLRPDIKDGGTGGGGGGTGGGGEGGESFDPCTGDGPGCQDGGGDMVLASELDSAMKDSPNNLIFGVASKATMKLDTSYSGTYTLTKVSGPGDVTGGPLSGGFSKYAMVDLTFNEFGIYQIEIDIPGIGKDTIEANVRDMGAGGGTGGGGTGGGEGGGESFDPCLGDPGCVDGGGTEIFVAGIYDTLFERTPIAYFAGSWDPIANKVDTSYSGSVNIAKVSGPGSVTGDLSVSAMKWGTGNIEIDMEGTYQLEFDLTGLGKDTIEVIVKKGSTGGGTGGGGTGGGSGCTTASSGERENLGLYGGSSLDLSFSQSGRLFGAISTPASLFITDDTARTWYQAFPDDSLEYDCGRGWGGRALRVLTNTQGWVGVQTSQEAGTLTSAVISFADGDTGTWRTAFDGYISSSMFGGGTHDQVKCVTLTDYNFYVGSGSSVYTINETATTKLVDASSIASNAKVLKIAAANNATGLPLYLAIDTDDNPNNQEADLYMYDGASFTLLSMPTGINGVAEVYASNGHTSGDTLFISCVVTGGKDVYRSFDGGSSWTDLGFRSGWSLSDVDYHPSLAGVKGDGTVLIIPGDAISYDLGDSWENISLTNNGVAVSPADPDLVVGTVGRGVVVSNTGTGGSFEIAKNFGLEAVRINQITRSPDKSVFYVATSAGLAFTTKYLDNTMANFDKWNAPYGDFPISGAGDDAGLSAVAIDPNNSDHVIAGYSNGFTVTHTGAAGFSNVMPSEWNTTAQDPSVQDIIFVNSNVVIAVTGGGNGGLVGSAGNIYRSTDGGDSWSQVTPTGFYFGTSLAMGATAADTVIYAGCGSELSMDAAAKGALWKSTDKGVTWTKTNVGPTAYGDPASTELPIFDIAVDPRGTDTLYICAGSNLDNAFAVSTDGGASMTVVDVTGEGAFSSVMINLDSPDTVYTAIRRELYIYDLVNDKATLAFRGLPGELIPDLVYGSVIAGSSTGMWKLDIDEPIVTATTEEVGVEVGGLVIYPNPNNGNFNINFPDGYENLTGVMVVDLQGKVVINERYNQSVSENTTFQITSDLLSTGTYFVIVQGQNGSVSTKISVTK